MQEENKKNKKKNHFIPIFYLKNFLEQDKEMLLVLNNKTGKTFESKPENIGCQNYLYSLKNDEGDLETDTVEDIFSNFEGLAAKILKIMGEEKRFPNGEDFNVLMEFVAFMKSRVPIIMELESKSYKEYASILFDIAMSDESNFESLINKMKQEGLELKNRISYKKIKEMYDKGYFIFGLNQNGKVMDIFERISFIKPDLFKRNWTMILTDDRYGGFITSDNPVCIDKLEITIPLSRYMALSGRFDKYGESGYTTGHTVAEINSRTAIHANIVYSGSDNFIYLRNSGSIGCKEELMQDINRMKRDYHE